jgi:hypothetical protein
VYNLRAAYLPLQEAEMGEQEVKTVWVEVVEVFRPTREEGQASMAVVSPHPIPVLAEVSPTLPAAYLSMVAKADLEEVVQVETDPAAEVVSLRSRMIWKALTAVGGYNGGGAGETRAAAPGGAGGSYAFSSFSPNGYQVVGDFNYFGPGKVYIYGPY